MRLRTSVWQPSLTVLRNDKFVLIAAASERLRSSTSACDVCFKEVGILQVDELLRRCSGGGSGKEKGKAAWNLCALLFTSKTSTSPMYSALANQFDGKVAFGEVRGVTLCNTLLPASAGVMLLPNMLTQATDASQFLCFPFHAVVAASIEFARPPSAKNFV